MSVNERQERNAKAIDLAQERDFSLGALHARPSSREVLVDGKQESVEPRVMQVMVALVRRSGEVVSREQLVELCWAGRTVSEDALNRSIAKVRRFAGEATFSLETIPRVGYRLTAVQQEPPQQPAPLPSSVTPEPVAALPVSHRSRWRPVGWVALAIVSLVIIGGGAYGAWQLSIMDRPYFAVLAFDVAGDPGAAQFAETVPHAIGAHLTAQGFEVVSPAVSFQYRGARKSAVAEELEPRYVIDGTVRVDGDRLRISTRVDSTLQPVTVWAQDFDMPLSESRDATERVATAMANLFNPGVNAIFQQSPEVVAGMMRIGARWRVADDMGAYVAAQELLRRQSMSLTARMYSAMAAGFALDLFPPAERAGVLSRARTLAEQASKEAWAGAPIPLHLLKPPVEWAERERLLRKGLKSDYADSSGLRRLLAVHLATTGHLGEALAIATQALSVDRLGPVNNTTRAGILDSLGRSDEADEMLTRAVRLWPATEYVERARLSSALTRGDIVAAAALVHDPKIGPVLDPPAAQRPLAAILRALESRSSDDIAQVERECADPGKLARDRATFCLRALVMLDRLDTLFALAPAYFPEQRGATAPQRDARWLADPRVTVHLRTLFRKDMQAVRADERFVAIAERMGLVDYWRSSGRWPDFCEAEPQSVCARLRGQSRGVDG